MPRIDEQASPKKHAESYPQVVSALSVRSHYGALLVRQRQRVPDTGLHPDILKFAKAFQRDLDKLAIPFFTVCGPRGRADQEAAFARGNSKARFGQSPHNYGLAVDMVHGTRFWDLSKKEWAWIGYFSKVVANRIKVPITWGGDWGWDMAHWQLRDWKSIRDAGRPLVS
jgi:hypothetical protein